MRRQRASVNLGAAAGPAHALRDIEDDARESVLVDKDFLVVRHLAQLGDVGEVVWEVALEGAAEEKSAFVVGHCCALLSRAILCDACEMWLVGDVGSNICCCLFDVYDCLWRFDSHVRLGQMGRSTACAKACGEESEIWMTTEARIRRI